MTAKERLAIDAIRIAVATYGETRRRTHDDLVTAVGELKRFVPRLIADGIDDHTQLAVKALTRLRELETSASVVPASRRGESRIAVNKACLTKPEFRHPADR
jgi:hypothetical protein